MLMRRFHIAKLLLLGATYDEISRSLGVGKQTIKAVALSLSRNDSGYVLASEKLDMIFGELDTEERRDEKARDPDSLETHIRKYSAYYALEIARRKIPKAKRNYLAGKGRVNSLKKLRKEK